MKHEPAEPACEEVQLLVPAEEITTQDLLRGGNTDRFQVTEVKKDLPGRQAISRKKLTRIMARDHALGEQQVVFTVNSTTEIQIYRQKPKKQEIDKLVEWLEEWTETVTEGAVYPAEQVLPSLLGLAKEVQRLRDEIS